ncbi:MAG: hypothetical protein Q8R09_03900, partial [Anaerolineaceae bacterium]|nr:hypothetical protein [Anaerolineaceae bacterium]
VNQKIEASSPFWFVRKTTPSVSPAKKAVAQKPQPIEKKPAQKQNVVQPSVPKILVENPLPLIDLDAQVANPLDINNDVVGKINDLYKNVKKGTRAVKRKKKAH